MKNLKANNVKIGENTNKRVSYADFLRSCKARYEADKTPRTCPIEICEEQYNRISEMLRLSGNGDVPVSAYVESVFVAHVKEYGLENFLKEVGYEYY